MDGRRADTDALDGALTRIGDRWTPLIVYALLDGPARFADLQRLAAPIAPNILAARLKRLEADALIVARPYSDRPPRMAYELTAAGRDLEGALRLLAAWGSTRDGIDGPHHGPCGTSLEARWYCPTCGDLARVDDDEADVRLV